jgi:hypothetical protein
VARTIIPLHEFPAPMIRLACDKCGRVGQYRKGALVERFGRDIGMADLLGQLAACPRRFAIYDACRVQYVDRLPPPKSQIR